MSSKLRYRRKLVSDKTLLEMKELINHMEANEIDSSYFGVYVDSVEKKPVYKAYVEGMWLKGYDREGFMSEIDMYIKFRDRFKGKGE